MTATRLAPRMKQKERREYRRGLRKDPITRGVLAQLADALDPQLDPYASDPVGWINRRLGEEIWSKERDILESVRDYRYTACQSAHGTGKSHTASRAVAWWLDVHPIDDVFVVTTAPSAPQVKAILWRYVKAARRKGKLPGYITEGEIPEWKIDGRLVAYGRKPQDLTNPEEAATAFQGIHAKYVLVILDEAGGVPPWLWNAVDTLVTSPTNRVLAIGNPDDPSSQFEKVNKPGSGWNQIQISAFDTPAFTGEDVSQELLDVLVSPEWVEERKRSWGEESPIYISKVHGMFPEVSDDALVSPAMLREAQLLDLPGFDHGVMGLDVARKGADRTVCYRNRGGVLRQEFIAPKQDLMKTVGRAKKAIDKYRNEAPMYVDSIGLGAGVFDRLNEQDLPVAEFNASEKAWDPKKFKNRRAEAFWGLRELFQDETVDIDPKDEELAAQLGSIKWSIDSSGRIVIESKEDMKKRGLPSPDRADAAMMASLAEPDLYDPRDDEGNETEENLTGDLLERAM